LCTNLQYLFLPRSILRVQVEILGMGQVANAVYEFVLPRKAGDDTATSPAGIVVSVSDRLDSLVGLFAANCAPTASADPFAMRRMANGMLQTLIASQVQLDLQAAIAAAAELQPIPADGGVQTQVLEFVRKRLEVVLGEGGGPPEIVRAVLQQRGHNPTLAAAAVRDLQEPERQAALERVLPSVARAVRIGRNKKVDAQWQVRPDLFELPQEAALHQAYQTAAAKINRQGPVGPFLEAMEELVGPINAFFEDVFVMTEDADLRNNRQALLRDIAALPDGFLDFSELPGF